MDRLGFSGDEVWGLFALGALCTGDIDEAAKMLSRTGFGYTVGFLARLAVVAPGVAIRTMWGVVERRWR